MHPPQEYSEKQPTKVMRANFEANRPNRKNVISKQRTYRGLDLLTAACRSGTAGPDLTPRQTFAKEVVIDVFIYFFTLGGREGGRGGGPKIGKFPLGRDFFWQIS